MSDTSMNDDQRLKETLSALMDGEVGKADQLELRRLVRSLGDHPELLATYERYLQVHSVLKGEPVMQPAGSFLAGVWQGIDAGQQPAMIPLPVTSSASESAGRASRRWFGVLGRVAIAASVAVIAVGLVQMRSADTAVISAQAEAQREMPDAVVARNNRMLNPSVMTVSAGNHLALPSASKEGASSVMSGCVLDAHRSDPSEAIWEKALPPGYAVCRQNPATHHCDVVSEKVGCYLH